MTVVGVLFGSPDWANPKRRTAATPNGPLTPCTQPALSDGTPHPDWIYCVPDEDFIADFTRFVAMIANRYSGLSGQGRIHEFLVWNEVNHRARFGFDIGSAPMGYGGGLSRYWLDLHNCLFGKAFDQVRRFQPTAPVYVYLDHYFGVDDFVNAPEKLSGFTVIDELALYGGQTSCFAEPVSQGPPRDWRVAAHPYSVAVGSDVLDPQDDWRKDSAEWKFVTAATLGRLTGWLRQKHPDHAQGVLVSEVGFTSFGYGEERQANGTCRSYREALANPDIVGYITNRYMDTALPCVDIDSCLGLRARDGRYKLAWRQWSAMDRVAPFGCGFDVRTPAGDVAVLLKQYVINGRHWATTRTPVKDPPAASESWRLLRGNDGLTTEARELFECTYGGEQIHTLSAGSDCGGASPLGSLGFTYTSPKPGFVELLQCRNAAGDDFMVRTRTQGCAAGWSQLESLGYVAGSVADVEVVEGDSGTRDAVFSVSLIQALYEPVVVGYATADGTATAGSDYVAASGALTFAPGTQTQSVTGARGRRRAA